MSYQETAYEVMKLFLTDFTESELKECISKAYDSKFDTEEVIAPIVEADGTYIISSCFTVQTIAFGDMAFSILPHLLITSAKKNHVKNEIVILTATSGDTGKAALAGFCRCGGNEDYRLLSEKWCQPDSGKADGYTEGDNTFVVGITGISTMPRPA